MKILKTICIAASLLCGFVAIAQSARIAPDNKLADPSAEKITATAPVIPEATKLSIRNAQHKRDAILKQMAQLNMQFLEEQIKVQQQMQQLQMQERTAEGEVAAEIGKAKAGMDDKWTLDPDTLVPTAVSSAPEAAKTEAAKSTQAAKTPATN